MLRYIECSKLKIINGKLCYDHYVKNLRNRFMYMFLMLKNTIFYIDMYETTTIIYIIQKKKYSMQTLKYIQIKKIYISKANKIYNINKSKL